MVDNFPGPYELRFRYDTVVSAVTLQHQQRLNLALTADPNPGDAFNNIQAITRGGIATPDLQAACGAWLTLLAQRFHTSTTFGIVELWKYTPLTYLAQFISAYTPAVAAGVSTDPTTVAQQETFTSRTVEGGIHRIQLMESVATVQIRTAYPTLNADIDAIFDFVASSINWILARDTSYPFASLNHLGGQNEKLFRIRFR